MIVFKLDLYHGTKITKMEAVALTCSTRTLNQQFYKILRICENMALHGFISTPKTWKI